MFIAFVHQVYDEFRWGIFSSPLVRLYGCGGAPEGEAVGGEGEGGKGCCDALHFVSVY